MKRKNNNVPLVLNEKFIRINTDSLFLNGYGLFFECLDCIDMECVCLDARLFINVDFNKKKMVLDEKFFSCVFSLGSPHSSLVYL